MVKSLLSKRRAGHTFKFDSLNQKVQLTVKQEKNSPYKFFRLISSEPVRLLRDIIWKIGRINKSELKRFISEYDPDIIFTQRMGSVKMCRIERIVKTLCDVPIVAYTGDDEYSLKFRSYSPTFWLRRLWVRHELRKNIPMYSLFYSMSQEQMGEFEKLFGSKMKFLVKTGNFCRDNIHLAINTPIIITYAGKLYCNRWKTLAMLAECISELNARQLNFILQIYTQDNVTARQNGLLNDGVNSIIKGQISGAELRRVYSQSDILLHVESLDDKYSLATKYSFSTKIMECLSSGCAVMAIGKPNQAGCAYLKEQDAAMVVSSKEELMSILRQIEQDTRLIQRYAERAYLCGSANHSRDKIQQSLLSDFQKIIGEI